MYTQLQNKARVLQCREFHAKRELMLQESRCKDIEEYLSKLAMEVAFFLTQTWESVRF